MAQPSSRGPLPPGWTWVGRACCYHRKQDTDRTLNLLQVVFSGSEMSLIHLRCSETSELGSSFLADPGPPNCALLSFQPVNSGILQSTHALPQEPAPLLMHEYRKG